MHGSHKTTVVGVVQRGGKVAALVTPQLMPIIRAKVMPKSMIYTDEWAAYDGVTKEGYRHRRIAHAEKVCGMGDIHANTIERFWSLLKNSIRGVYHSVSGKHLQSYINEYSFHYNNQRNPARRTASSKRKYGRYVTGATVHMHP